MRRLHTLLGAAAIGCLMPLASLSAQEVKLPPTLAWTAYDTGTTGYNQSVAVGKALKDAYGVDLRVIPGKTDISRIKPLIDGKVNFSANGSGTFFSFEGLYEFGVPDWGPQKIRLIASASPDQNLGLGVAADAGIKTVADMRGKRVAVVLASPALQVGTEAILAFGGLTLKDVVAVTVPGYGQSWDALINGQADVAFAATTTGPAKKLEASPRGIFWPPMPHDDEAGWERLLAKAPFYVKNTATAGAGISKDKPHVGGAYPYPILITTSAQEADLAYSMAKALIDQYPKYKDALPEMLGWSKENQKFMWAVPYHEGAIKAWKEAGAWTDEHQAHNDALLAREKVLQDTWTAYKSSASGSEGDAFTAGWNKARTEALTKAGLKTYSE